MFTTAAVVCFVALSGTEITQSKDIYNINPRIIKGYDARQHQFPWQVGLNPIHDDYPAEPGFSCGGAILDKTHVLTAAHCVVWARPGYKINVEAGAHNSSVLTEPMRQVARVCRIKIHPLYNKKIAAWDFALLTLSTPLVFNHAVKPIRLPPDNINFTDLTCIVTGWGQSSANESDVDKDVLQALNVSVVDSEECKRIMDKNPDAVEESSTANIDTYVCSKPDPEGRSACVGDSGSPLACFDVDGPYLLGVVSFGDDHCQSKLDQKFGTAFSKVPVVLDWITCKS